MLSYKLVFVLCWIGSLVAQANATLVSRRQSVNARAGRSEYKKQHRPRLNQADWPQKDPSQDQPRRDTSNDGARSRDKDHSHDTGKNRGVNMDPSSNTTTDDAASYTTVWMTKTETETETRTAIEMASCVFSPVSEQTVTVTTTVSASDAAMATLSPQDTTVTQTLILTILSTVTASATCGTSDTNTMCIPSTVTAVQPCSGSDAVTPPPLPATVTQMSTATSVVSPGEGVTDTGISSGFSAPSLLSDSSSPSGESSSSSQAPVGFTPGLVTIPNSPNVQIATNLVTASPTSVVGKAYNTGCSSDCAMTAAPNDSLYLGRVLTLSASTASVYAR